MTKNYIVARWLGWPTTDVDFDKDYNYLMEAWQKFRDLEFDDDWKTAEEHVFRCIPIGTAILHKSITEAFDELCKGIEWYESLKK